RRRGSARRRVRSRGAGRHIEARATHITVTFIQPRIGLGASFRNANGQDVPAERLEAQATQPRSTGLRRARRHDRPPGLSGVDREIGRGGTVGGGTEPREDRPFGGWGRWFEPRQRESEAPPDRGPPTDLRRAPNRRATETLAQADRGTGTSPHL